MIFVHQIMPYGDPFGTQAGCFVQEEYSLVFIEDAWTAEAACGLIDRYLAVKSKK